MNKTITQMKHSITVIAAALMAMAAVSCGSDNDNGTDFQVSSLVTYLGNTPSADGEGVCSEFELIGTEATQYAILTTTKESAIKTPIPAKQRMVIAYNLTGGQAIGQSGTIYLMGYKEIPTIAVQTVSQGEAQAADAEMPLYYSGTGASIARTGNYINAEFYLPVIDGRTYAIYADETTVNTKTPELYVTSTVPTGDWSIKTVQLVSFNIEQIWRNPVVEGVKVHVNNTGGDMKKVFEFKKNNL